MKKNPNIVYFFCDELRTDALECYGNNYVKMDTPNIDWIAQQGVLFNHCFCNSPVCVPSRMSILTGLYPEDTGVYHNEASWKNYKLDKEFITMPQVLEENGYITASFGKTHLPKGIQPFMYNNEEGSDMKMGLDLQKDDVKLITPGGFKTSIGGRFPEGREYPPERVTQNAIEWMKKVDNPYYIRISYLQPHTPVFPRSPFDLMYYGHPFPRKIQTWDKISKFEKRFADIVDTSTMTEEEIYLTYVYYYGLVSWIDLQVGLVLDYLKENNMIENTILVFGADHGASLGDGGCYAKQIFAPQSHRVPLIISYPEELTCGKIEEDICENLDLARTLFSLIGIEAPMQFKGRNLFSSQKPDAVYATIGYGYKTSKTFPNKNFGTYLEGRGWPRRACIRTQKYRLDKNIRIDGELVSIEDEDIFFVDTMKDPKEKTNMVDWPEYRKLVEEMLTALNNHIKDSVEPDEELTHM